MAYTENQKIAIEKYLKNKTDDIRLRVPKGTKELWQKAAALEGYSSMTKFVLACVEKELPEELKQSSADCAAQTDAVQDEG